VRWNDGRWEQQNGRYVWIEGSWGTPASAPPAPVAPPPQPAPPVVVAPPPVSLPPGAVTQAPPPPQAETAPSRAGYVWIRGRWGWTGDQKYAWIPGHWERARSGKSWADGRWETRSQGGTTYWIYVDGGWR
jgi:hypothetical protein